MPGRIFYRIIYRNSQQFRETIADVNAVKLRMLMNATFDKLAQLGKYIFRHKSGVPGARQGCFDLQFIAVA